MPVILVYSGQVLRFFCRYPFPLELLQPPTGGKLQFSAILIHAYADPRTALVVLNHPSDLAVDSVDLVDQILSACLAGDLLNAVR